MPTLPWSILVGDARASLAGIPDRSVHCCVTSPPYWSLRSYSTDPQVWGGDPLCDHLWNEHRQYRDSPTRTGGEGIGFDDADTTRAQRWTTTNFCSRCGGWRGELGSEPDPDSFVAHLVEVFREVHRVLRDDGTLWLNLGDGYAANRSYQIRDNKHCDVGNTRGMSVPDGLKPKDLLLMPARLAIALQTDGWYLRSDICWVKPNPMPESCTDRPTSAYEHILLLTKSPHYYYDHFAGREPAAGTSRHDLTGPGYSAPGQSPQHGNRQTPENPAPTRNLRNVWHINPPPSDYLFCQACSGYWAGPNRQQVPKSVINGNTILTCPTCHRSDAWVGHYAAFPLELPRRCLALGAPSHGVCPNCSAPWTRVTDRALGGEAKIQPNTRPACEERGVSATSALRTNGRTTFNVSSIGWQPSCSCGLPNTIPATILDPFLGTGTSLVAATSLNLLSIGLELNPAYAALAHHRVLDALRSASLSADGSTSVNHHTQPSLFDEES